MIYLATIFWAILIFIGSSIPGPDLPSAPSVTSYLVHFFEFGILGILLAKSITRIRQGPLDLPRPLRLSEASGKVGKLGVAIVLIIGFLYAMSDEIHQIFVSGRNFELTDLVVDGIGLIAGIAAIRLYWRN